MMLSKKKEIYILIFMCLISFFLHYISNNYKTLNYDSNIFESILFLISKMVFYTFKPIEVFFHEASHSITAIIVGREFVEINLDFNGSGYVSHRGFSGLFLTAIAGYLGATIWGFLIYLSSIFYSKALNIFLIIMTFPFLLYANNFETIIILVMIISIFLFSFKLKEKGIILFKFIGIFIMISSIYSPIYLFNHSNSGDHISLNELTYIPSTIWITLWVTNAMLFLGVAFKINFILLKKENKI